MSAPITSRGGSPADRSPVVVLGYDVVSPLGTELGLQLERARAADSGVGDLTRFPLREGFPVRVAGEVEELDPAPYDFLRPRKMALWRSPIFSHGMLVVHRALRRAGLEITPELAPRVAVTFSTAIGGLDAVIDADRELVGSGKLPAPWVDPNSCVNMVTGKVSILTGATGPITSTITACATGSTSMIVGAMFLQAKMADVAICGAVDFPLVEPIVAGFATMNGAYQVKAGVREPPTRASRPFSVGRRGFVISEGAACVVLATREFATAHGLKHQIELAGWHTNSDAHHYVAPNPKTVAHCMAGAIAHAGLVPDDIDAVNAHAASTKVGDRVEADTLTDLFGAADRVPPVSANKSQIGHAMGASSAIESVFAMEGMVEAYLLPTINHMEDPEIALDCVAEGCRPREQEHLLKNAFGFGGCNACLVFRRVS